MDIKITIANKHCTVQGAPVIVCGNSDYVINFTFDEEWAQAEKKTARFSYVRDGARKYKDVDLTGNTVAVPPVYRTRELQVGVYAGDLVTSTSARIPCKKSAVCDTCTPDDLDPNQYKRMHDQLTEELTEELTDKLAPALSESGSMVTCEPVEGYPLTVTAEEGATAVTRCGKNLAKPKSVKNETSTGITVDIQDDGTFILNGTAQVDYANGYLTNYLQATHGNRNKYPAGTYFLKVRELGGSITNGKAQAAINAPSGTQYLEFTNSTLKVVLTEASEVSIFVQFRTNNGVGKADNNHISVQMELGSTATDYEPYNGETFAPGEDVPALPGVNNIWADAGEVTVTGRADPTAVINKLTNAILALGGNI